MKAVCRRTGLEQQQHAHAAAVPPHIAYLSQPVQQQTAFTSRVQMDVCGKNLLIKFRLIGTIQK